MALVSGCIGSSADNEPVEETAENGGAMGSDIGSDMDVRGGDAAKKTPGKDASSMDERETDAASD